MTLILIWSLLHFFVLFYFFGERRGVVLFMAILSLLVLFHIKPDSFDLNFYLEYFRALDQSIFGFPVEPGFRWINYFLVKVLRLGPDVVLLFWQVVILLLCIVAGKLVIPSVRWYVVVVFILLSLYYVLSAHNGLRLGVAQCLVFLGFVLFSSGYRFLGVVCCILALFFHRYIELFVMMIAALVVISRISEKQIGFPSFLPAAAALLIGVALAAYAMEYGGVYGDPSINWGDYRSSTFVKLGAIGLMYFSTEWLIEKGALNERAALVSRLRGFIFFIMIPLAFAGEIFTKVAMFYFLAEAILMIALLSSQQNKNRAAGGLIMLSYGVAPNAWNIISAEPRQWLGFLQL